MIACRRALHALEMEDWIMPALTKAASLRPVSNTDSQTLVNHGCSGHAYQFMVRLRQGALLGTCETRMDRGHVHAPRLLSMSPPSILSMLPPPLYCQQLHAASTRNGEAVGEPYMGVGVGKMLAIIPEAWMMRRSNRAPLNHILVCKDVGSDLTSAFNHAPELVNAVWHFV